MYMFERIFVNLTDKKPLVQCITNFVTVNDCANIILACGGSPTMAHHKDEVEEIAACCHSLVLNMGTVSDKEAMILAGRKCNELNIPVIIDPVGMGVSELRNKTFEELSENIHFSVIRGNVSEIKRIATGKGSTSGVDASEVDKITENNIYEVAYMAKDLSKKMGSIIVVSGPIDVVADKKTAYIIRNGHPIMSRITGSGCMSTALLGAFCGANKDNMLEASAAAVAAMGVCGELAQNKMKLTEGGTMTFRMFLIDYISNMTSEMVNSRINIKTI